MHGVCLGTRGRLPGHSNRLSPCHRCSQPASRRLCTSLWPSSVPLWPLQLASALPVHEGRGVLSRSGGSLEVDVSQTVSSRCHDCFWGLAPGLTHGPGEPSVIAASGVPRCSQAHNRPSVTRNLTSECCSIPACWVPPSQQPVFPDIQTLSDVHKETPQPCEATSPS